MPKIAAPTASPERLRPIPLQPWSQPETPIPAIIKGRTSQFGIRRLRRSVNVAIARTIRVGHQAIEFIRSLFLASCRGVPMRMQFTNQIDDHTERLELLALSTVASTTV